MSKITVTTIAGQTSGADANKVKIESGDTLEVVSNATVGGTLGVTGATTVSGAFTSQGIDDNANNTAITIDTNEDFTITKQGTNTTDIRLANSSNSFGGNIKYDHNVGNMIFHVHNGERARFRSDGGICFNGDTAAANDLNDYEEGTWTPDLRNADNANSFTTEEGYYTKIGNRVFAQFRCDYGNTGGGGGIQIRNLPFTYNGNFSCVGIVAVNGGSMSGNNKQYAVFATSGTTFQIYNGGSISSETYTFLSGSLHYLTNS